MSTNLALTTPLKAEIRIFSSQAHLDAWVNLKKVDVFKSSNIPGAKLYIVHCGSYGDLLVIPVIVSDEKSSVESKPKEGTN